MERFGEDAFSLESPAMYGSIFSVLLMGMVPVWGGQGDITALSNEFTVAPPASAQALILNSLDERLTASGAVIVDLDSGQTVYGYNVGVSRPMASLTKLMTALIIVENHDLDELVTVPEHATEVIGATANLPAGEQFTVGDLLSALLIKSANDAAVTLAEFHSGSVEAFVDEMNTRSTELGLKDTIYENPIGFDAPTQKSTPRDLAWLAMFVMRFEPIAERMGTPTAQIASRTGRTITVTHTHQLLRAEDQQEILAGKTGTTDAAGQCLLSIVEIGGRRYITVLLHSRDRYADMRQVLTTLAN